MLMEAFDSTRRRLAAALSTSEMLAAAAALERAGVDAERADRLVQAVVEDLGTRAPILALRTEIAASCGGRTAESLERLLLIRAATRRLPALVTLPVSDDVKRLTLEAFDDIACPHGAAAFDVERGSFVALAKLTTLRRFPAGQFHWERSGIPRSWLLKVKGRERLALVSLIVRALHGLKPVFFIHLNAHRKNRFILTERESDRSYFRMAQSMALQPDVRALVASSWLNSPDTFAVSPHLAWMNRTPVDHGALEVTMGPASPDCGVLARSPERKRAYEAGTFKPTVGLVVWPRPNMLEWAAAHPEFQDAPSHKEDRDHAVAPAHAG